MPSDLIESWYALTQQLGLKHADDIGTELIERYREPHRRFHGPAHLTQVLDLLDELGGDPRLLLAAWFHDAVYQPSRRDNEQRSAELARERLAATGLAQADIDFVVHGVLATAGHADEDPAFDPLLDADLAVLGAQPDAYQDYRAAIRQEFAAIPALLFRPARARFLLSMLARPAIYRTSLCQLRFEAQARCNLQNELDPMN